MEQAGNKDTWIAEYKGLVKHMINNDRQIEHLREKITEGEQHRQVQNVILQGMEAHLRTNFALDQEEIDEICLKAREEYEEEVSRNPFEQMFLDTGDEDEE